MEIPGKSIQIHLDINDLIERQEWDKAIEELDNVFNGKTEITPEYFKVQLIESYIVIADQLSYYRNRFDQAKIVLLKGIGLLKSHKKLIPQKNESLKLFHNSVLAYAYQIKYSLDRTIKSVNKGENNVNFNNIENIYEIKDTIQTSLSLYRDSLKLNQDSFEAFNIRNNIAVGLYRVGRFIESMTFYKENFTIDDNHIKSSISWGNALQNLLISCDLLETASLHFFALERLNKVYLEKQPDAIIWNCERDIKFSTERLKQFGFDPSDENLKRNRNEEIELFKNHSELRKFSLVENLALSEHSLFCHCTDSAQDDLILECSDQSLSIMMNTIKSEFAFSRFLLFQYKFSAHPNPNDLFFTGKEETHFGYSIEHLKQSFKVAYGILDKLGNAILEFYKIPLKESYTYFENVFDVYRAELEPIKNINLCGLYSLSLDLNKDVGKLRLYKKLRNIMEHEYNYRIVDSADYFNESNKTISIKELEQFTLELLKLARSAIFSFVFMIRRELKNERH